MSNLQDRLSDVIIIEGPPGAGKGYLSSRYLQETPRTQHITTGGQVRGIRAGDIESEYSSVVMECLAERRYLPDDIFGGIILEEMVRRPEVIDLTLIDGFPHNVSDFEYVQEQLRESGRRILGAVCLDATVETCVFRMGYRGMREGEDVRKDAVFSASESDNEYYAGRYDYYLATRDEHRALLASIGLELALVDTNPDILQAEQRLIVQGQFNDSINSLRANH